MRKINSLVMSAVLAVAGAAVADETKPGDAAKPSAQTNISYPSRTSQINKHLSFVDLYLSSAVANTKALSSLNDAESGKMDTQLIAEARRNLDGALDRALAHMKYVREYKSDLTMATQGVEPSTGSNAAPRPAGGRDRLAKLDALETQLKEAKSASKTLAAARLEDLGPAVDGVSTHLLAAHQTFRDIAKWTSYTMLEDSNLATVPVKGQGGDVDAPPAGQIDRELSPTTAPDQVTPRSPTDVDKSRGKTTPGPVKAEPVAPAPGGGR